MTLRGLSFAIKKATVFRQDARVARELGSHESLSPEQVRHLNDTLMLQQVRFAMDNTRFYPRFYHEAGIERGDLASPDVLAHLPLVTKQHVREHTDEFVSSESNERTTKRVATGGSTGEPLVMARDLRVRARAYEWRLLSWWGLAPQVHTGIVYRFFRTPSETMKQRLVWWPSARFQLDAFTMDAVSMRSFLDEYVRVRPELLIGYAGGILELARFASSAGIRPPGAPVIATTAAPITWQQREEIEAVFGGRVYDHYRCAELNWMAGECRARQGLHVFEDLKRVEVLGEDLLPAAPGTSGQTVVTDFTNRVFPLIRYRLGDVTSLREGPCDCGLPFARIDNVRGRVNDTVRMPSGEVITGEALGQTFSKVAEAVRQFQIHQHTDYSLEVKVIPRSAPDDERVLQAVEALRVAVGDRVPVSLSIVEDLPHEGGKTRFILSDLPQDA